MLFSMLPGVNRRTRLIRWMAGSIAVAALSWHFAGKSYPYLPPAITIQIKFPEGIPGRVEPIICTGVYAAADFFELKFLDPTTGAFTYDSWGVGGPTSPSFKFEPGSRRTVRIEMPALANVQRAFPKEKRPLRIMLDGRPFFEADVRFHPRAPERIYFGYNPIGGTTAGGLFRGEISTVDGRVL